ncbi:MAG: hypothetical protein MK081_15180 [Flavobacteriales bacterium]|nr:hypothetical protein [Flavobacteriales bacterium]MCH2216007.1 hypothetical protein [Flavobacteriales bacterium]
MATVNSILKKSDNGRFLFHAFLGEQFNVDDPKKCRCLNRFYSDTKADVIFFEGKGGRWRFHDHGDSSFSGDVFEYAKWHFDLHDDSDFPELLKQCDALLKKYLNGEGSKFKDFKPIRTKAKAVERKKREFSIEKIAFTNEGLAFWEQSGVTKDVLTEHRVCQINGFSETDEYGEVKVVDLKDSDVCFAYQFPGFVKLYFPMRKEYRYQFLGCIFRTK